MSTLINHGPRRWSLTMDKDWHREYKVVWGITTDNVDGGGNPVIDNPASLAFSPGLAIPGSTFTEVATTYNWSGFDDWAFCTPELEVEPIEQNNDPAILYELTQTFTTVPQERCQNTRIENPLLEPYKISGGFVKYRELYHEDRDGKPYISSKGGFPLVGEEVKADKTRWQIDISFNILNLNLGLVNDLSDNLNESPMWGLPAETIKFSRFRFSILLYGVCTFYYNLSLGFDIRKSWEQRIQDKTRYELRDGGDATKPRDWKVAKDAFGENMAVFAIDTAGLPWVSDAQTPNILLRNPYATADLFQLNLPVDLLPVPGPS